MQFIESGILKGGREFSGMANKWRGWIFRLLLLNLQRTGNVMEKKKRKQLEGKGFRVGSAADFLELTPEEEAYIEIRLDISSLVKTQRTKSGWTQGQLARAIGSSQSRIAKLEGGDPGISLDLMIKALLRLGTSKQQIGKLLGGEREMFDFGGELTVWQFCYWA